jgi:hypothetical protein
MIQLFLAPFAFGIVHCHIGKPGLAAIMFLIWLPGINSLSYGVEVSAARLAEFQIIALRRTASWAKHKHAPVTIICQ